MKKVLYISLLLFLIILLSFALLKPGFQNINNANKIKVLTENELLKESEKISEKYDKQVTEINAKYNKINDDIFEKYLSLNSELEKEYTDKKNEIAKKYTQLEKDVEAKYKKKMWEDGWFEEQQQLNKEKSELTSKKWNEESALNKEKNQKEINLSSKKMDEVNSNNSKKSQELSELNSKKRIEIKNISDGSSKKASLLKKGIMCVICGFALILINIFIYIKLFNKMTKLKNNVNRAWADVEVQLKKRYDLIPNLIETIKNYSSYEKDALVNVISARNNVNGINDEIKLNSDVDLTLKKIMALTENYPELKANSNYQELMTELRKIEDTLSIARMRYNKSVEAYKNARETVPTNIVAELFNFKDISFYEIKNLEEKENVKVAF